LQLSAHFFWPLVNPDALHSAAKYNFIIWNTFFIHTQREHGIIRLKLMKAF
jgi:hypothetical protein